MILTVVSATNHIFRAGKFHSHIRRRNEDLAPAVPEDGKTRRTDFMFAWAGRREVDDDNQDSNC